MNRAAVPNAVELVRANKEGTEASTGQPEKCTQPFALSVVPILWYRLRRVVIGQSIVAIVSVQ
jgi:hypothetical protein